ncbi:MAG: hypothetical protein LC808_37880, partial [Actinobacteria bacterium]|nr:hypothetical protein [Actinomycetota bacterium]
MTDPARRAGSAKRARFHDSWKPWVRSTVLSTWLLAIPAIILIFSEQPFILVIAGTVAGTSAF